MAVVRRMRRHACGLTGSLDQGDRYVAGALEALIEARAEDPEADAAALDGFRIDAFRHLSVLWRTTNWAFPIAATDRPSPALGRLERLVLDLPPPQRQVLLLREVERFGLRLVASLVRVPREEAAWLLADARRELLARHGDLGRLARSADRLLPLSH